MRTIFYIVLSGLILLAACEEPIDWKLDPQDERVLVVDGIFTNENLNHLVKLSLSNKHSNEGFVPASNAQVVISDGTDFVQLTEFPLRSGFYYTPKIRASTNRQYILFIQYGGEEYFASDRAKPVELMKSVDIRPVNDSLFTIFFTAENDQSYIRHFLTWENTAYCSQSNDICFAQINHYDLKTVDVNDLFKSNKERVLFPENTILLRKKYSISNIYRAYLRALLSETEWRGGLFDIEKGNVFSNVSNGALGFFAVSTVVSDTTIVTR